MAGGIYKYAPLWGEWQIDEAIGKGSYGEVYKIYKIAEGQRIEAAAKFISIPRDEDRKSYRKYTEDELKTLFQERADKFSIEIASMLKLRYSQNVVRYEDHIKRQKEDGLGWDIIIRMELLNPLEDYLDSHSFTRKDVVKLGMDICGAIECCQDNDIIHRDIKIENIFVDSYNTYKLGDFGVSKVGSGTATGTVTGTEDYMAPEISKDHKYNKTVDIYALGIAMYQLLNNRRKPFIDADSVPGQEAEAQAHLSRITGKEMPPPKYADGELARIVLKACAFDKDERYLSPQEMANDLRMIYDALPDEMILKPREVRSFVNTGVATQHETFGSGGGTVADFDGTGRNSTLSEFGGVNAGGTISDIQPRVPVRKKSKKGLIIAIILALLLLLSAGAFIARDYLFGEDTIPVEDIGNLPEETVQMVVEDTYELAPLLLPEKAEAELTYASADENIATVNENGVVTAVSVGEVEISVTAGKITETVKFNITAKKVAVTEIDGLETAYSLEVGDSITLYGRVVPDDATVQTVNYTSSDESIVTVGADGYVNAKSRGSATITAEADGVTFEITVTVRAKSSSTPTKPRPQPQPDPQPVKPEPQPEPEKPDPQPEKSGKTMIITPDGDVYTHQ